MPSVNRVILVGHLGKDPDVRKNEAGSTITSCSMATTEKWKDKSGEKQERTEWHRIVFFGKLAEIAGEYLKKGSLVYIEGSLHTRKWQDKDGVDRYTTEITASSLQMIGGRKPTDESAGSDRHDQSARREQTQRNLGEGTEDIPF